MSSKYVKMKRKSKKAKNVRASKKGEKRWYEDSFPTQIIRIEQ